MNSNGIIIYDTITDTVTQTHQMSDFECKCNNNQTMMIRNGLVASLVFSVFGDELAQLVTYERGQNTVTVIENFGET